MPDTTSTIVVTGAAGFIGSHVCEALLRRGDRVLGLDNFDSFYARDVKRGNLSEVERTAASLRPGAFRFAELDLNNVSAVTDFFERERPTGVIHLAGKPGVRPSMKDPMSFMRANVEATSTVLEASRRTGVKRVALASSSSVYGDQTKTPFSETDDVSNPISPYAASKRACELLAATFHHLYQLPIASLRFFTVYGPRQRPDLAISKFIRLISRGESDTLLGDGSQSRDFTFVDDIVGGVLAAHDRIERHGCRIWNLGHAHPVTVREMLDTIARVVGKPSLVKPGPPSPGDVQVTYADLSRSRAELGYEPKVNFEEGIRRQWEWFKAQSA